MYKEVHKKIESSKQSEIERESEKDIVRNKSYLNPRNCQNSILYTFCDTLNNLPRTSNIKNDKTNFNLLREESTALESLANDESMVIKVTDEGGAVVIMDSNFYKYHIIKMLSNTDYYYKIPTNDDKKMQKNKESVKNTKPKSCLTKKEEDYLTNYIFGSLDRLH